MSLSTLFEAVVILLLSLLTVGLVVLLAFVCKELLVQWREMRIECQRERDEARKRRITIGERHMFHKHDWEIIDKTVLPSGYQQMATNGEKLDAQQNISAAWFRVMVIYLFQCKTCHKIKKVTESNPWEITTSQTE